MYRTRTALLASIAALSLGGIAACGSSGDDGSAGSTPPPTASDTTVTTDPDATTAPDGSEPGDEPTEGSTPAVSEPTSGPPPSVAEPLYAAGDIDKGLAPFVDQAVRDLADRLDVEAASITTHAAVLVVWPDTSLGCPQPGMSYAQVLTDGSVIELEHDGTFYRYHTGGDRGPFLCEQGLTKAPPVQKIDIDD